MANESQSQVFDGISLQLSRLNQLLELQLLFQPKPFIFLKSGNDNLSSNVANNVEILVGPPVDANHRATVKDFNIVFGTVAGTVKVAILSPDHSIKIIILSGINSSTNGLGETVLEEGERLAVLGSTAGAGTLTAYCSGVTQRIR